MRPAARILWRLHQRGATAAHAHAVHVCVRTARAGGGETGDAPVTVTAPIAEWARTQWGGGGEIACERHWACTCVYADAMRGWLDMLRGRLRDDGWGMLE
jgi:hypothetical protein